MIDEIKAVAETLGTVMTLASAFLVGRTGKVQRYGLWVSTAAAPAWITFAICTSSWLMIAQTLIITGFNLFNLFSPRADRNVQHP